MAPEEERLQIAAQYEPEPDNTDAYNEFITERHKSKPNPNIMRGNDLHLDWATQFKRYKSLEEKVKEHKNLYQNRIKNAMDVNAANEISFSEKQYIKWNKQFIVKIWNG